MGNTGIISPLTLTSGRVRVQLDKEIKKLNIDKTPLLKLMSMVGKKGVGDMTYKWLTKERRSEWGGISSYGGDWSSGANKAGTIVVTSGEGWKYAKGDIIKVIGSGTDINIHVDSVATDTLTCRTIDNSTTLDFSSTPPTGANKILNISNSFEIGGGRGTIKSHQPSENLNYIQIVQHPYGVVETSQHLEYEAGGTEFSELEKETMIEHEFSKERLFFFGQKHKATTGYQDGTYEQYFTGGILEALSTNVTTESDLTQAEFSDWVNQSIYYAKKPVIFAGETVYEALSWWLGQKLQTRQDETTLGIAVANYMNEYGQTVKVIPHRELLKNSYAGYAFCVDLDDIGYRYLNGEDTHLEVGIQSVGYKQEINEFRTWFGVYMGNEKRHGVLKGVTSISA